MVDASYGALQVCEGLLVVGIDEEGLETMIGGGPPGGCAPGRLARFNADSSLELSGALVGNDLKIVGSTGVKEIDGRGGPVSEDDGPLLLSHGDVLCVVVPVIAEGMELSLKFVGDGEYEGIVGGGVLIPGTEEGAGFGLEEGLDLSPDLWSDGGCVGHAVVGKEELECFMRVGKAEGGGK
ncbi:g10027 [Coccomyxa elongata]